MIKVIKFREVFLRILLHFARRWATEGRERFRGTKRARRASNSRPSSIHRLAGADVKLAVRDLGRARAEVANFGVRGAGRLRAGRANSRLHLNGSSRDALYTTVFFTCLPSRQACHAASRQGVLSDPTRLSQDSDPGS